ncbi:hypothetical protein ACQX8E_14780 [Staphylococcus aureus]|uniref:DUF7447 family protein n=1 Tax=Staphylococcus aureus TaxID=1280 RepID=UPI003D2334A2
MKHAKTVPMSEIRAYYAEKNGGHWFNRDTMRFFKTVLPRTGYLIGDTYYFVTRETNPSNEARYSVRSLSAAGALDTVGKFHSYRFREGATEAIAQIALTHHEAQQG